MGDRIKLIYCDGKMILYPEYSVYRSLNITSEIIFPAEYMVKLFIDRGEIVIYENERGVYIKDENGVCTTVTESELKLPIFTGHPLRKTMKILHHEILINIIDGLPVPNFFVYKKPWYRDGAMMAMFLERTDNLRLISNWANSLCDCL